MYYKTEKNELPIIKSGSIYDEVYSFDGCFYLKYEPNNFPTEELGKITEEEFLSHRPDFEEEGFGEEPTQLDRIEAMVAKDRETIAQEAVDAYTMELIEEGVL